MAILRNIAILTLLSLLLPGCYEDFNPTVDTEPVLAINALITAGEPIDVELTHTWIYSEGWADEINLSVDDASVTIYANDVRVSADYIPQEGDQIKIIACSKKYGSAEATVLVPYAVRNVDVQCSATLVSEREEDDNLEMNFDLVFDVSIGLTLTDRPDTSDFYRFSFAGFPKSDISPDDSWTDCPVHFLTGTFDDKFEPIFSEHISAFESLMGSESSGFTFFTDRQFSGKEYTLHLRFNNAGLKVRNPTFDENLLNCGYTLELQSVSQSYYNWENYKWQIENSVTGDIIDLGFGNPIWGYSNVSTGAGAVAARSIYTHTINLKDFLQSILK